MMIGVMLCVTVLIAQSIFAEGFAGTRPAERSSRRVSFAPKTSSTSLNGLLQDLSDFLSIGGGGFGDACVMGDESIMSPKAHGTSETPVQSNLRWDCDKETADRICNYNRHYAEYRGYFVETSFPQYVKTAGEEGKEITFYDSNTGKPLFVAPKGRSVEEFYKESQVHGWPSFRDSEVVWENVRCLPNGEAVSVDGTHLGHNLPDATGNRYCINLVSAAGNPE
mmetsp:Transcript_24996/g.30737  ORF Transcript_24996/g.30737 Transcript_24996/m.30737 type:complete len:223 (-) Transcript_24996:139-807(-)